MGWIAAWTQEEELTYLETKETLKMSMTQLYLSKDLVVHSHKHKKGSKCCRVPGDPITWSKKVRNNNSHEEAELAGGFNELRLANAIKIGALIDRATINAAKQAEKKHNDQLAAEKLEAEKLEAEKLEAEKLEAEKLEAEKLEAEKLEAEKAKVEGGSEDQKPEDQKPEDQKPQDQKPDDKKPDDKKPDDK